MRTARSRTSGENLFDFVMAPSSQTLEPPQFPGRFSSRILPRSQQSKVQVELFHSKPMLRHLTNCRSTQNYPPIFGTGGGFIRSESTRRRLQTKMDRRPTTGCTRMWSDWSSSHQDMLRLPSTLHFRPGSSPKSASAHAAFPAHLNVCMPPRLG